VVRKLKAPAKKGIHRIAWDLRFANNRAINPLRAERPNRWNRGGAMVVPGTYSVSMAKEINGTVTELAGPVSFEVVSLYESTLKGASDEEYKQFMNELNKTQADFAMANSVMHKNLSIAKAMKLALERASIQPGELNTAVFNLNKELLKLNAEQNGLSTKNEVGVKNNPSVGTYLRVASRGLSTSYGPTEMHKDNLKIAKKLLSELTAKVAVYTNKTIPALEKQLQSAGAPVLLKQ